MISWPGHLPEGAIRGQIAHACDWMPTIAELCGVKLLNADIDGKSLTAVIRSAAAPTPARRTAMARQRRAMGRARRAIGSSSATWWTPRAAR